MTSEEFQQISGKVGERKGWDFSSMNTERDPVPWDYIDVVKRYLKADDEVLDVGTGGGEKFLQLAPYMERGLGIDIHPKQVEAARSNLVKANFSHISFEVGDGADLPVENETFNMVLNRQANDHTLRDQYASEVVRVLRSGGIFILQEIGRNNVQNISEAFNGPYDGPVYTSGQLAKIYESLGCHVICLAEYDVGYFFSDVESFVFWAKVFFESLEERLDVINQILKDYMTPRGIKTNESKELLIVQKN